MWTLREDIQAPPAHIHLHRGRLRKLRVRVGERAPVRYSKNMRQDEGPTMDRRRNLHVNRIKHQTMVFMHGPFGIVQHDTKSFKHI